MGWFHGGPQTAVGTTPTTKPDGSKVRSSRRKPMPADSLEDALTVDKITASHSRPWKKSLWLLVNLTLGCKDKDVTVIIYLTQISQDFSLNVCFNFQISIYKPFIFRCVSAYIFRTKCSLRLDTHRQLPLSLPMEASHLKASGQSSFAGPCKAWWFLTSDMVMKVRC